MLPKGANVDIATGRPVIETRADKEALGAKEEEASLKRKAIYANILATEPGKVLVGLVAERLKERVRALVESDPEAGALVKLLKDIGVKENVAEAAMDELARKYLRKEE